MSRWSTPINEYRDEIHVHKVVLDLTVGLVLLGTLFAGACPRYEVWRSEMRGRAELRRAEQNRRIAVQEAEAKRDAAIALADAEIARAKGVDSANKIIGAGLKGNEDYLRYLWIMSLEQVAIANGSTVVYVPTEGGLPILEANRFRQPE